MMERQLAQMVRLIDDLLDVSRITRGKFTLRKERVALTAAVQMAVEGSRPLVEASGHRLTVALPPEPVHLPGRRSHAARPGVCQPADQRGEVHRPGGHIRLTAARDGGEVVVSVTDTGIGIAPEQLPRLFAMFLQVDSALDRSQGGLGIGLALVRGLVEMHGGTIEARSEGPGKGSEFVVRLPVTGGPTTSPTRRPVNGDEAAVRPGRRILVADDNRDAADSLAVMLRLAGHEVHAVHDGQAAVEAMEWFRPDVALLDIGMPRLNGFEAARHIRGRPQRSGNHVGRHYRLGSAGRPGPSAGGGLRSAPDQAGGPRRPGQVCGPIAAWLRKPTQLHVRPAPPNATWLATWRSPAASPIVSCSVVAVLRAMGISAFAPMSV